MIAEGKPCGETFETARVQRFMLQGGTACCGISKESSDRRWNGQHSATSHESETAATDSSPFHYLASLRHPAAGEFVEV